MKLHHERLNNHSTILARQRNHGKGCGGKVLVFARATIQHLYNARLQVREIFCQLHCLDARYHRQTAEVSRTLARGGQIGNRAKEATVE